jgi:hypothetical protein
MSGAVHLVHVVLALLYMAPKQKINCLGVLVRMNEDQNTNCLCSAALV